MNGTLFRRSPLFDLGETLDSIIEAGQPFHLVERWIHKKRCSEMITLLRSFQSLLHLFLQEEMHSCTSDPERRDRERHFLQADAYLKELIFQLVVYAPHCESKEEEHLRRRETVATHIDLFVFQARSVLSQLSLQVLPSQRGEQEAPLPPESYTLLSEAKPVIPQAQENENQEWIVLARHPASSSMGILLYKQGEVRAFLVPGETIMVCLSLVQWLPILKKSLSGIFVQELSMVERMVSVAQNLLDEQKGAGRNL